MWIFFLCVSIRIKLGKFWSHDIRVDPLTNSSSINFDSVGKRFSSVLRSAIIARRKRTSKNPEDIEKPSRFRRSRSKDRSPRNFHRNISDVIRDQEWAATLSRQHVVRVHDRPSIVPGATRTIVSISYFTLCFPRLRGFFIPITGSPVKKNPLDLGSE